VDVVTECPLKRCTGHLEVWASGTDVDGRPVAMAMCDRCGRLVEQDAEVDGRQESLFGGDA